MNAETSSITYPRNHLKRSLVHGIGHLLLPLLFNIKITGRENFPESGPLIVVGNHTAAMEAVFINIYTPWQMEMLSAADIPAEPFVDWISQFYGVIPLHRGSFDRSALRAALEVLDQNGVIGLFPEGGIWEEGKRKAQSGVAWLSYRSAAPVLPIGFSDTTGKLNAALKLKRPEMNMNIGAIIPPARLPEDQARKTYLQGYADQVMDEVHQLVPPQDRVSTPAIRDEDFEVEIKILDQEKENVPVPEQVSIQHPRALAKVLHRPAILKIFRVNLNLPVEPLQQLHQHPTPNAMLNGIEAILQYLEDENPYLLTYRFGPREGFAMENGLREMKKLLSWADQNHYQAHITPIRKYTSRKEKRTIIQTKQGTFQDWM